MKFNKWTVGLAAIGVVSLASAVRADEAKMSQVQTALSNTTISGYVDVSAQWNLNTQNRGDTPEYAYGGLNKADGFNLNAVDIALDKPLDESPWAAGYHAEFMVGPDSPLNLNNRHQGYLGLRQGYISLRTPVGNGIDWKVGVFDSILGYESTSDPLNPNFTRSYGYSIEPTTLTGVLATYKVVDALTLQAGVADNQNGINGRMSYESRKAYMGGITLTAPDSMGVMKGATLNMGVITAPGYAADGSAGVTSWYAGAALPTPITKMKVGAAFDYKDLHNGKSGTISPKDDSVWVVGAYATFQATDKLNLNLRGEYLSNDGTPDAGDSLPYNNTVSGRKGNAAEEITATVDYALWANVLSRVEFRWDHTEHDKYFDDTPQGNVEHDNAFMLALNLIYKF